VVGTMLLIRRPANVDDASTVQLLPPFVERVTPKPGLPSRPSLLVLPVPANRVSGRTGLMASELMDNAGKCLSVRGVQVGLSAVELVVFQTPPLTRSEECSVGEGG